MIDFCFHLFRLGFFHARSFILLLLVLTGFSCTDEAVLSQLLNSRMQFIFKGTYESNDPHPWAEIYMNDHVSALGAPVNSSVSVDNFRFYLDIAQIGLSSVDKQKSETTEDDWSYFFKKRTLFCPVEQALDGSDLKTCVAEEGRQNHIQLFEEGVSLQGSDVAQGSYKTMAFVVRRMITSPAGEYSSANVKNDHFPDARFDNRDIEGTDISRYYAYGLADDDTRQDSRVSPYLVRGLDINIDSGKHPYVLEARIFLKNLFMKHVIVNPLSLFQRRFFVGPSDWLTNHEYDRIEAPAAENRQRVSSLQRLGGTILMTARIYFPHEAGSIQVKAGTPCAGGGLSYIAAIPADETFDRNKLPLAATQFSRDTENIFNLPPGDYKIYKTHDKLMRDATGEVSGKDGFPESFTMCSDNISVTASMTNSIDISSCACP